MVTYTTEALQDLVGAKPVGPINPIHERPTFSSLWHLQQQLLLGIQKVTNTAYPNDCHSGYITSGEAFALYSTKEWQEPADVGECFEIPPSSITETEQRTDEKRWELQKEKRNTFENLLLVLTKTFEDVIDPALHTDSQGLATRGFGNTKPYDVLPHMNSLYGKPSLTGLEGALLRLNEPMNRNHPIEVTLRGIEEVQIFRLANPKEDR